MPNHVPEETGKFEGDCIYGASSDTWITLNLLGALARFHPEMALFRNLGVNLRDCLCGVLPVRLLAIP